MEDVIPFWHRESYERFVMEGLPELLSSRVPLRSYRCRVASEHTTRIELTVGDGEGAVELAIDDLPRPDARGVFHLEGQRLVVLPTAASPALDREEILCVGEQLHRHLERRIAEAPPELPWDVAMARAWLAIGQWVRGFLLDPEPPAGSPVVSVMPFADNNWMDAAESPRRLLILNRDRYVDPGQKGRICPVMTPEGGDVGRVVSIARGAAIRGRRLVIDDRAPVRRISVTASMIPVLQYDDANRALMGANMMRQWRVPAQPERALVQSGEEPDERDFWCGRNLLTAFVCWGGANYEDGLVISAIAARKLASDDGLVEVGDRLSNRHGAKGVVSAILPDERMPELPDGRRVELLYHALGVPTRMNFGQLREALLGELALHRGQAVVAAPFESMDDETLRRELVEAGLPEDGLRPLRDPDAGALLERPSTAGPVYWGACGPRAREVLALHPGAAPQALGPLDYRSLREVGAHETVRELFNTRDLRRGEHDALAAELRAAPLAQAAAPSPGFAALQRRLAAVGIALQLEQGGVQLSLAKPEGERLELATPVPHPWLTGERLECIGALPELPGWAALVEANRRLHGIGQAAPAGLQQRAAAGLEARVGELFDNLLEGCHLQPSARVAYSGRAVIVPGAGLEIDRAGLPEALAWPLFGPLVARELGEQEAVAQRSEQARQALEQVMARSWVLLSRGPSPVLTSTLAFRPELSASPAVVVHPMAAVMMEADFDGDQVGVFLPLTREGQAEAGERLSVRGHLLRDPSRIRLATPTQEAIFGLAWLARAQEGRDRIARALGHDIVGDGALRERRLLVGAIADIMREQGAERALSILQALMRMGFAAAQRSGASPCAFATESLLQDLSDDEGLDEQGFARALAGAIDRIEARTDYEDPLDGAEVLALKCGARGAARNHVFARHGRRVVDSAGRPAFSRRGLIHGLEAETYFASADGARIGLGRVHDHISEILRDAHDLREPEIARGYGALARAMRSTEPGRVLARAALAGERDPLTDLDARLLVGLAARRAAG